MTTFEHTIGDPIGLHARPASALVKKAKELACSVTIQNPQGKTADANKDFCGHESER